MTVFTPECTPLQKHDIPDAGTIHCTEGLDRMNTSCNSHAILLEYLVECSMNDIELLFSGELDEVHCVATHSDGELWIEFRMLHCIQEYLPIQDVHIDMVSSFVKVSIEKTHQILRLLRSALSQCTRYDTERIGDPILCFIVGNCSNALHACDTPTTISTVHGIRSGGKRLSPLPPIGSRSGLLSIDYIAGDCEHRECRHTVSVAMMTSELPHETLDDIDCNTVDLLDIVSIGRESPLDLEIDYEISFISDRLHFCVLYCTETVCNDTQSCDTSCHGSHNLLIV